MVKEAIETFVGRSVIHNNEVDSNAQCRKIFQLHNTNVLLKLEDRQLAMVVALYLHDQLPKR